MKYDYHHVSPEHADIHARLVNWALWASPRVIPKSSPMWRWTRSNWRQWHEVTPMPSVNMLDAQKVQGVMYLLDPHQRSALQWAYLLSSENNNPASWCRKNGFLEQGKPMYGALYHLIHAGRAKIANCLLTVDLKLLKSRPIAREYA